MEIGQKLMDLTTNTTNNIINKELSIQISLSGLSFCILDREQNTILQTKSFDFDRKFNTIEILDYLKHILATENELKTGFNNVTIVHDNDLSTLVPKPLFNEDCLADYLKFNSKILKSDFIAYDQIQINDSVNVYVPYVNINNLIFDTFGTFTYKHVSTILIEEILQLEKNSEHPKVYVNVNRKHFEIICVDKGKLKLYNTFEYHTKEDFIYYILFTTEQLGLNPETFQLVLLGNIIEDSSLYKIAYKYIRNVSFGNRNETYHFAQTQAFHHTNFTLIKSF